jgi:hypothetical protein
MIEEMHSCLDAKPTGQFLAQDGSLEIVIAIPDSILQPSLQDLSAVAGSF